MKGWIFLTGFMMSFLLSMSCYAQQEVQEFKFQQLAVYKDSDGKFLIKNKRTHKVIHKQLIFARQLYRDYLQMVFADGEQIIIDRSGKEVQEARQFFGLCGTVPHYHLTIKEDKDSFYVMEDEYFYDADNRIPARAIVAVSKKKADALYLINGASSFKFTSNYHYYYSSATNPRNVIFEKDGAFGILGKDKAAIYEKLKLKENIFLSKQDGLYGYPELGILPKYKSLGAFEYHLAAFELPDGRKGFVDKQGKEYFVAQ